ncbi:MAG: DUF2274 domain-containing protein [Novosphingobium sp.]|nr:MAG: DUF2274 domain-containing protein [Novosphingobium sp.]
MTLLLTPQLNEALGVYAELYRTAYGHEAAVVDLVPAMLETFLAGDKAFAAARRK